MKMTYPFTIKKLTKSSNYVISWGYSKTLGHINMQYETTNNVQRSLRVRDKYLRERVCGPQTV